MLGDEESKVDKIIVIERCLLRWTHGVWIKIKLEMIARRELKNWLNRTKKRQYHLRSYLHTRRRLEVALIRESKGWR